MNRCEDLPNVFDGKSVRSIPELHARVDQIHKEPRKWIRIFRCRECGQEWIEEYKGTGHGEVPSVRKRTATDKAGT